MNDDDAEWNWCVKQREVVIAYLAAQRVQHGRVGEWPAWHLDPYVSIWAVESHIHPEFIGWWAISGDLPTDYISSADIAPPQHPRKAMIAIANNWLRLVDAWRNDREVEGYSLGNAVNRSALTPLLESRAEILLRWADDDSNWEE